MCNIEKFNLIVLVKLGRGGQNSFIFRLCSDFQNVPDPSSYLENSVLLCNESFLAFVRATALCAS